MDVKLLRSRILRWTLLSVAAVGTALGGAMMSASNSAQAGSSLEGRKQPMRFSWVACEPNCGWVSAVGIITGDSPKDFDDFSKTRDLTGTTVVLDSSGGSVNDAIALGRRFRELKLRTTVGISVRGRRPGEAARITPEAYCESMCVFLLLAGTTRYVPERAHVRVHQIWMGDRADDAKAASYTAQDMMIVERDIGRLAKYTFDMGGAGDLLSLALNVPPWEDLHELSHGELGLTNLVTTQIAADVLPQGRPAIPMAELTPKGQDRFGAASPDADKAPLKSTRTAEAVAPASTGATTPAQ
ncbi:MULTISPECIES: hypothetical protein [unclassified Bradyrhizobium]|uniref:COG3904 family protein n=1 Tax=unclassified Bradyrhizobium TaxID=2631580 RepID=UPI0028EB7302|nr:MULTISPECIES: hypothetical protein [unclassified Bradyrhizobium]